MKRRNYNLKESFLFGLVRIIISLMILTIGSLIFYVSLNYFNPEFKNGYLIGKEESLLSIFRVALMIHSISAILSILIATPLLFFRIEHTSKRLHRTLGKILIYIALLFLVPSAFVLSLFAMGGIYGKIVFIVLSVLTLIFILKAYDSAKKRKITEHKYWMRRFYILLTSAIWLRINLFIFHTSGVAPSENSYLLAAILSWLPQLILFEILIREYSLLSYLKIKSK